MQRGMFRSAVVLVSSLAMGSLLFVVAAQIKSGAAVKPGAAVNPAAAVKSAATAKSGVAAKSGSVRVWEEKVVIPTYLIGRA